MDLVMYHMYGEATNETSLTEGAFLEMENGLQVTPAHAGTPGTTDDTPTHLPAPAGVPPPCAVCVLPPHPSPLRPPTHPPTLQVYISMNPSDNMIFSDMLGRSALIKSSSDTVFKITAVLIPKDAPNMAALFEALPGSYSFIHSVMAKFQVCAHRWFR
jgi:hypothetical protein